MPLTILDSKIALVVIDLQKGVLAGPKTHPVAGVIANAVKLVDAFRERKYPVVLVHVGYSPDRADAVKARVEAPMPSCPFDPTFSEYVPELRANPATDLLIQKRQWGAFYGTELDLQLRRRQITQIVLCGVATSIGVESTARDAWERSYNLAFAIDAMTDPNADAHNRATQIIFPRIGEVTTTDEIIEKL